MTATVSAASWISTSAAEPWRAEFEIGGEVDSNVRQVDSGGEAPVTAPMTRSLLELGYGERRGSTRASARGLLGVRTALSGEVTSENLLTVGADGAVERRFGDRPLAATLRATHLEVVPLDGVEDTRAYASSGADLELRLDGGQSRWATLAAGARRQRYKPDADFDWSGSAIGFALGHELWRDVADATFDLRGRYQLEYRDYRGAAVINRCGSAEMLADGCVIEDGSTRVDLRQSVAVEATYTGDQVWAAAYKWTDNRSTSFGQSVVRHRLQLSATIAGPAGMFATAAVAGQLDRYRDPLVLPSDAAPQLEVIDEENRSAVSLRVARPISTQWQVEARGAYYANVFATDEREFRRWLAYGGVTWESGASRD